MDRIRVLLADDHTLFRRGVASILAAETDIEIVGEADDGRQAVEMARALLPDVILMDLCMPVMDGLDATRQVKAQTPRGEDRHPHGVRRGAQPVRGGQSAARWDTSSRRSIRKRSPARCAGSCAARLRSRGRWRRGSSTSSRAWPGSGRVARRDTDPARARGARRGGEGPQQQADRRGPRHHREHGEEPPQEHAREAAPRKSGPGRYLRFARGPDRGALELCRARSRARPHHPEGPYAYGPLFFENPIVSRMVVGCRRT